MSCLEFQCQASEHFMPVTCSPKHHSWSSGPGNPYVAVNYPSNDEHCASCHGESKRKRELASTGDLAGWRHCQDLQVQRWELGLTCKVSVCGFQCTELCFISGLWLWSENILLKISQISSICRWIESVSYRTHGLGDGNEFSCQLSLFLAYSSNTPELSQL